MNIIEEEILIPENRFNHILKSKRKIEELGKVELSINKSEHLVKVISEDAVKAWIGKLVVRAIARGFDLKEARKLFNTEFEYIQIDLRDFHGKNKNQQKRLKSRIIGRKGTAKRKISSLTNTDISIFGKTISVIGEPENIEVARKAIEMLLSGARHATVYQFIMGQLK